MEHLKGGVIPGLRNTVYITSNEIRALGSVQREKVGHQKLDDRLHR